MKWDAIAERNLCILALQQFPSKPNIQNILDNWPADQEVPSFRAANDRLNNLRKQVVNGAPVVVPATPRSNAVSGRRGGSGGSGGVVGLTHGSAVRRTQVVGPTRPIVPFSLKRKSSAVAGQNTKANKSAAVKHRSNNSKVKKDETESEAQTSDNNDDDNESSSNGSATTLTPTKTSSPSTTSRRSLPRRSKTPITYNVDSDNNDEGQDSHTTKKVKAFVDLSSDADESEYDNDANKRKERGEEDGKAKVSNWHDQGEKGDIQG